jgi:hypothetical protein
MCNFLGAFGVAGRFGLQRTRINVSSYYQSLAVLSIIETPKVVNFNCREMDGRGFFLLVLNAITLA